MNWLKTGSIGVRFIIRQGKGSAKLHLSAHLGGGIYFNIFEGREGPFAKISRVEGGQIFEASAAIDADEMAAQLGTIVVKIKKITPGSEVSTENLGHAAFTVEFEGALPLAEIGAQLKQRKDGVAPVNYETRPAKEEAPVVATTSDEEPF